MGLNRAGPLIHGYFSIVTTTLLHSAWPVDSGGRGMADMENL